VTELLALAVQGTVSLSHQQMLTKKKHIPHHMKPPPPQVRSQTVCSRKNFLHTINHISNNYCCCCYCCYRCCSILPLLAPKTAAAAVAVADSDRSFPVLHAVDSSTNKGQPPSHHVKTELLCVDRSLYTGTVEKKKRALQQHHSSSTTAAAPQHVALSLSLSLSLSLCL
jgi:hypothetical protein